MTVKYHCPKCGRRFVEWGGQKMDFKCPTEDCEQETLILVTPNELPEKPKPKRTKKRKSMSSLSNPKTSDASGDTD